MLSTDVVVVLVALDNKVRYVFPLAITCPQIFTVCYMDSTDFFDENDTFSTAPDSSFINESKEESVGAVLCAKIESRPLADLVEEVFAKHFAANGESVVDTLAKIDPGAYIKHVASLVPKQVAVKSDVRSTHEIKGLSREIRNSIDLITGRVYDHEPAYAPIMGLPAQPDTDTSGCNVDSFFDN